MFKRSKVLKPYLEDPEIDRWYRNIFRGSAASAYVSLRVLHRLCKLLNLSPRGMVEKARSDLSGFQGMLEDMVARLEDEGKAPKYISKYLDVTKNWLRYNDVILTRKIKVSNATTTPTIENERVPLKEELARIFRASPPRIRVAEAFMALADLRPQTLGNFLGTDGLRIGDLPEMRIEDGEVVFEEVPTRIIVRSPLSKARHKYFTFLPSEGCKYLKEYLEQRIRNGEQLKGETPLIGHRRSHPNFKPFIQRRVMSRLIKDCMRNAGVYKRPYVLRAYAETQLIIAESRGKISHPYLQFVAGHVGDIEAKYSTNKGFLPPVMIEDMRKCYRACEPFLCTTYTDVEQSDVVKKSKVEALKSIAKTLLDLDLVEVKVQKEREIGEELSVEEEIHLYEDKLRKLREKPADPQMIVDEGELGRYLAEGWKVGNVLPSKKIVIERVNQS